MSRQVLSGTEIRAALLRGVNTLANTVTATLGPKGRCIILERNPMWPPVVTKDGVTVSKEVRDLADPYENAGAQLIREAASKTSDQAGDGTTTATLLAQRIYQKGLECLDAGANPVALKRGIDKAVAVVVEHIKEIAQPVEDNETIARVGTISSNGDRAIGDLIANAMARVGRDGVITISDSNDADTTLQVSEGMQIDRGWFPLHPFVTNPERLETVMQEPYILLTERKMFTMTDELSNVLAAVGKAGHPVLLIVGDYDQPFIVTLIHNLKLGQLMSCVVKAPAFGDDRRAALEDLAVVTGGYAFTENCGRELASITIEDLGRAVQVTVEQASTTIVGGYGDVEAKESRMTLLRSLIEATDNEYQRELLRKRLARLASGVAVIKVGAVTEAERNEKKDRIDDAVCATHAAVEEGIVPGGGMALILSMDAVSVLIAEHLATDDEAKGMKIIYDVLREPLLQICANAGEDGSEILNTIVRGGPGIGYNAATGVFEDLIQAGVIDPAKVIRCAILNAASVSALMLCTEAMVCTMPEKKG
jgi:chaperonin GroEL